MLDASSAFAADHTLIDGMIAVAINVCDFAIFQMHFDAATAGAHVTGCGFNFVPVFGRCVDLRLGEDSHRVTIAKQFKAHYGPYFCSMWSQLLAIF